MTISETLQDSISDPDGAALTLIERAARSTSSDADIGRTVRTILVELASERARRAAGGRARAPRKIVASRRVVGLDEWRAYSTEQP
ncbi:MAG TPA: hypothetical protein VJ850_09680 [Candidatus Limnocylindrales bacterium]|nr:hypothetical protein [Candidatus Limnocylindrales bacterium]